MKKEIKKQLEKIYVAVNNANSLNDIRIDPDNDLKNKLLIINKLTKECLEIIRK